MRIAAHSVADDAPATALVLWGAAAIEHKPVGENLLLQQLLCRALDWCCRSLAKY
jgi:hypothetical protein